MSAPGTTKAIKQRRESTAQMLKAYLKRHPMDRSDQWFLVVGLKMGYRRGRMDTLKEIDELLSKGKPHE